MTIQWNAKLWKESIDQFMEFITPLKASLGRTERRVAATRYIAGLLIFPANGNPSSRWPSVWGLTCEPCSSS